jgi:hypothetical protein
MSLTIDKQIAPSAPVNSFLLIGIMFEASRTRTFKNRCYTLSKSS